MKSVLLPVILLITNLSSISQVYRDYTNNHLLPSPTAYSLKQISSPNISLYNGLVQESFPVWTIQLAEQNFNIDLIYTSESVQIEKIATWVGMNFNLSAGGMISRSVRGLDDMHYFRDPNQSFGQGDIFANCYIGGEQENGNNYAFVNGVLEGLIDGEPDVFSFNIFGRSGKFIFDNNGSIHMLDQSPVEIIPPPSGNINATWEMIDENGTVYIFGGSNTYDVTGSNSSCTTFIDAANSSTGVSTSSSSSSYNNVVTSWHLKSITTLKGEVVNFSYEPYSTTIQNPIEETTYSSNGTTCPSKRILCSGSRTINGHYLSGISYKQYQLSFITSTRCDSPGERKLDQIQIYNDNNLIKAFQFNSNHSISNPAENLPANCGDTELAKSLRLWLHKVTVKSSADKVVNSYSFEYYDGLFPDRGQPGDDWGFVNDVKTGLAKNIKYHTGGIKTFKYEENEYSNFEGVGQLIDTCSYIRNNYSICKRENDMNCQDYLSISSWGQPAVLQIESFTYDVYDQAYPLYINVNVNPTAVGQPNYNITIPPINAAQSFSAIQLEAGSYNIDIYVDPTYYVNHPGFRTDVNFELAEKYCNTIVENKRKGGGARIADVFINNGVNMKDQHYQYSYEDINNRDRSSGKLMSRPIKSYNHTFEEEYLLGTNSSDLPLYAEINCYYQIKSKRSAVNVSFTAQGSAVGYSEMKVTQLSNNQKVDHGYSIYSFENSEEIFDVERIIHGVQTSEVANKNGRLLSLKQYNNANDLIQNSEYVYETRNDLTIYQNGYKVRGILNNLIGLPCKNVDYYRYKIRCEWSYVSKKITTTYSDLNDDYIKSITAYTYNNPRHKQPNIIETFIKNESQPVKKEVFTYSSDHLVNNTTDEFTKAVYYLNFLHVINKPLEWNEYKYYDGEYYLSNSILYKYGVVDKNLQPTLRPEIFEVMNYQGENLQFTPLEFVDNTPVYDNGYYTTRAFFYNEFDDLNTRIIKSQSNNGLYTIYTYDEQDNITSVTQSPVDGTTYYESFENSSTDNSAKSGLNALEQNTFSFPSEISGLINHDMSYWFYEGGIWKFSGIQPFNNVINSIGSRLDEIRVFPSNAQMTTYTYNRYNYINTITDVNGVSTHYHYDQGDRLKLVSDDDKFIVKKFTYHMVGD